MKERSEEGGSTLLLRTHAAAVIPAPNTVQLESGTALHCRLRALLVQKAVCQEPALGLRHAGSGHRNEGTEME